MNIAVVDYGVGNSRAVVRMYESIGVRAETVSEPAHLSHYSHAILPGVGHFGYASEMLRSTGWSTALADYALDSQRPLLGICLGAQLLGKFSEEGHANGLGLLPFSCERIETDLPVPNMGWRPVNYSANNLAIRQTLVRHRFYFSHSYEMIPEHSALTLGTFVYDGERVAILRERNITAAQFHPEKSHRFGKEFLSWFASS